MQYFRVKKTQVNRILLQTKPSDVSICCKLLTYHGEGENHLSINNKFSSTNGLSAYRGNGCISIVAQ